MTATEKSKYVRKIIRSLKGGQMTCVSDILFGFQRFPTSGSKEDALVKIVERELINKRLVDVVEGNNNGTTNGYYYFKISARGLEMPLDIYIEHLPKIVLTEKETIWLQEALLLLRETGRAPAYQTIRMNTWERIGTDFDPLKIDRHLAENDATEITLLGILLVEPDTDLLDIADETRNFIKTELIRNPLNTKFETSSIADKIGKEEKDVRLILTLISRFCVVWGTASSNPQIGFGYSTFGIDHSSVFEAYMNLRDIEFLIDEHYLKHPYQQKSIEEIHEQEYGHSVANKQQTRKLDHGVTKVFVDYVRLQELQEVRQMQFDLSKLITLCQELNSNYQHDNYYAIALLTRTLINHVPPIFGYQVFSEVANNYRAQGNAKSFKELMLHLDNSSRKIADNHAHSLISKIEVIPTATQIDFKNDLDILLGEIVRRLKTFT